MLLLVSRRIASAIGCWMFEKKLMACLAPSSKTSKSSCLRSVTYFVPSLTVTLSETSSTPVRMRGGCCWAPRPATTSADASRPATPGRDDAITWPAARVRARTVSPGVSTSTVIFSGGISVSGRA